MSILNKQVNSKIFWAAIIMAVILLVVVVRSLMVNNRIVSEESQPSDDSSPIGITIQEQLPTLNLEYSTKYPDISADYSENLSKRDGVVRDTSGGAKYELYALSDLQGDDSDISVFMPPTSHASGGTNFEFEGDNSLELVYIGLKTDPSRIDKLRIEILADYFGRSVSNDSFFSSLMHKMSELFIAKKVCACGPGKLVELIEESKADYIETRNGIAWYRLDPPITLSEVKPLQIENWHDPDETLTFGGGRLIQLIYTPKLSVGPISIQVHSFVFKTQNNSFVQLKTTGGSHEAYIVDSETGTTEFVTNSSGDLSLRLSNIGSKEITLDSESFEGIMYGLGSGKKISTVTLENYAGNWMLSTNISEKLSSYIGKKIPAGGWLDVELFDGKVLVGNNNFFYVLYGELTNDYRWGGVIDRLSPKKSVWNRLDSSFPDYDDKRIAMTFAIVVDGRLRTSGVTIKKEDRGSWNKKSFILPKDGSYIYNYLSNVLGKDVLLNNDVIDLSIYLNKYDFPKDKASYATTYNLEEFLKYVEYKEPEPFDKGSIFDDVSYLSNSNYLIYYRQSNPGDSVKANILVIPKRLLSELVRQFVVFYARQNLTI